MKNIRVWPTFNNLIPMLFFLGFCLTLSLSNPCLWLFGDPLFAEHCGLTVDNQTGKTLRVTPINTDGHSSYGVRLYRTTFPIFPAYQQRDIVVKSGHQAVLYFDCETKVSELYVCDQEGECYLRRAPYKKVTFQSLEALSQPGAALQATMQSFPEHNYSVGINVLLCLIQISALIGGLYWLKRTKPAEIPYDI